MSWKEIWENKGITEKEDFVLTDLMALDGYDTGAGCCINNLEFLIFIRTNNRPR